MSDWSIPEKLRPSAARCGFDLGRALSAVVGMSTYVPTDAYTAETLGTERSGSGVVIRADGLILTMAYLVMEAETIWITAHDKRVMQGHVLGVDGASGLALVQVLGRVELPVMEIGDVSRVRVGSPVVLAAAGGRDHAISAEVTARQEFAGYWEYLLEDALLTAPAHPAWGGAALIDVQGKLVGIGSLVLQEGGHQQDMNMVVPINHLQTAMDALLKTGETPGSHRPWLGVYAAEQDDQVVIVGLANKGPGDQGGLKNGDRVVSVGGRPVLSLPDFWRGIWALGEAGTEIPMVVERNSRNRDVRILSASRSTFMKAASVH